MMGMAKEALELLRTISMQLRQIYRLQLKTQQDIEKLRRGS